MTWLTLTFRSSRPEVFIKKGVLRNFAKFTGKHLCYLKSNLYFLLNIFRFCDHSFSTFAKFSEKTTFITPYMQTYLCVSGVKKCYFFGKFRVRIKWMIPFNEFKKFEIYVVEYHNETWWYISTTYEQHFQHNFSSVLKPGNYFQALLWFHKNVNIIMSVHF